MPDVISIVNPPPATVAAGALTNANGYWARPAAGPIAVYGKIFNHADTVPPRPPGTPSPLPSADLTYDTGNTGGTWSFASLTGAFMPNTWYKLAVWLDASNCGCYFMATVDFQTPAGGPHPVAGAGGAAPQQIAAAPGRAL